MKKLLIVISIFLFSAHAYPQIQPELRSLQALEWNRCAGHIGTHQPPVSKQFLAERYLGKSLLKKFEHYLKSGSGLRAALKVHDQVNDKNKISQNLYPPRKSKFYFKIEKGEWKPGHKTDQSSAPDYSTKLVICLIWNKADEQNGKSHCVLSFGDFSVSK